MVWSQKWRLGNCFDSLSVRNDWIWPNLQYIKKRVSRPGKTCCLPAQLLAQERWAAQLDAHRVRTRGTDKNCYLGLFCAQLSGTSLTPNLLTNRYTTVKSNLFWFTLSYLFHGWRGLEDFLKNSKGKFASFLRYNRNLFRWKNQNLHLHKTRPRYP